MSKRIKLRHEVVTPGQAKKWLERNSRNRRMDIRHAKMLAREMTLGAWKETGDPIRFDKNGTLVDGQHRLTAVILSGKAQNLLIAENVDTDVQAVIDTGRKRTFADQLTIAGYKCTRDLAAATRLVTYYRLGAPHSHDKSFVVSPADLAETFDQRATEIVDTVTQVSRWYNQSNNMYRYSRARAAGYLLLFREGEAVANDTGYGDYLIEKIYTGEGLLLDEAPYLFRKRIAEQRPGARLATIVQDALLIKSYNAVVSGQPMSMLRWRSQGPASEPFPSIQFPGGAW